MPSSSGRSSSTGRGGQTAQDPCQTLAGSLQVIDASTNPTEGRQTSTDQYGVQVKEAGYRTSCCTSRMGGHGVNVEEHGGTGAHLQSGAVDVSGKFHFHSVCHCQHFIRVNLEDGAELVGRSSVQIKLLRII